MVSDVFLITVSVMHLVTYHWCWEIDCLEINEEKVSNVFCLQKRTSLVGFFSKIQKKHKAESFLKGTIYCAKATSLTIVGKQQVFFLLLHKHHETWRCETLPTFFQSLLHYQSLMIVLTFHSSFFCLFRRIAINLDNEKRVIVDVV